MIQEDFITLTLEKQKNIALIAHDNEKHSLIEWCKEHKDIFAALEKRDAGQVRELMDYHIRRSMEDVLTRYQ